MFFGIKEEDEDCEEVISDFVHRKMKINRDIKFERVHRVGRKNANRDSRRPRPIVAKFSTYKDRELVRKQAPKTLKGSNFWVQEQFPPEIEQRRKALYPVMKEERKKNNKVNLVKDRLFINGSEYVPQTDITYADVAGGTRRTPSQQDRKRPRFTSR